MGLLEVTIMEAHGLPNHDFFHLIRSEIGAGLLFAIPRTTAVAATTAPRSSSVINLQDKMDPYVIVRYKGQERKTSVARRQGGNPKWKEKITLRAEYPGSGSDYKLFLRIMDKDTFSSDDFIGETTIYVEDLLALGAENGSYEMQPTKYRVENFDGTYCGDIKVAAKFISQGLENDEEEELRGWKHSYDE